MTLIARSLAIATLALSLGACSTYDAATRNAPLEVPGFTQVAPSFDVTELRVAVPKSLSVSEANVYYPIADIVWRGDPIGDRHQQVLALFAAGMTRGTDQMVGIQEIAVEVEVKRFHSLTEKARYSVGGIHSIRFDMTVRDATTGAVIIPTRTVDADLSALGGRAAIEAERNGITQKSRIEDHLAFVIQQELARPLVSATGL